MFLILLLKLAQFVSHLNKLHAPKAGLNFHKTNIKTIFSSSFLFISNLIKL